MDHVKEFRERWGSLLDGAEAYAISGCDTAPPAMLSVSADFMLDLVRLAKSLIDTPNQATKRRVQEEIVRRSNQST